MEEFWPYYMNHHSKPATRRWHFVGNVPATFGHPFWSLLCDFKMFGLMLTGQMDREIKRLGKRPVLQLYRLILDSLDMSRFKSQPSHNKVKSVPSHLPKLCWAKLPSTWWEVEELNCQEGIQLTILGRRWLNHSMAVFTYSLCLIPTSMVL
ncbi:hypothetical protein KY290_035620 [Solanum tuberosum]|uniref:Uncharacterized protein n=1 Tax=Solanum tuberosum TaxID=4113 RepID=A0ABQ7TR45_SOLTU|nr:hypothetical protein KY285_034916 [Solanum tuberosum]KAH0736915.1 hypothetical protein KY290_035620 [Solanum tuberosum]